LKTFLIWLIFIDIIKIVKSRRMRCSGHVARMGEKWNAYRLLVGKPEGKRPLGRPRCRWVDNIRMDLGEVGWGYVDWIGLAKDRNRWRGFYLWVLHPVAHLSNWFLMMPPIATKFQYVNSPFFILTHYMFRPLRAILR
jgi:hypothetical protein